MSINEIKYRSGEFKLEIGEIIPEIEA